MVEKSSNWNHASPNFFEAAEKSKGKRPMEETQPPTNHAKIPKAIISTGQSIIMPRRTIKQNTEVLITQLGRDISIDCLLRCSRSDFGKISMLNRGFRDLIRSGYLYRLRRHKGIVEPWIYYSCNLLEWKCFDPNRGKWMELPKMISNECFMCSDKESLSVGTEVLVFGKDIISQIIYKYSLLTNEWTTGMTLNTSRCLFASASQWEIAIIAGGCNPKGTVLNSAELYNADTCTWETIPSMNKARKMCAGVIMDGKFYALGGIGQDWEQITSGEEFDLKTKRWREIPNMFPARDRASEIRRSSEAPPLVAVVKNELYAADYALKVVRKYNKERNSWRTLGSLPECAVNSINGWGVAFRACGDRLIFIGGPRSLGGGLVEINSWVPNDGHPQWELLGSRISNGSFVYNCAVMGC